MKRKNVILLMILLTMALSLVGYSAMTNSYTAIDWGNQSTYSEQANNKLALWITEAESLIESGALGTDGNEITFANGGTVGNTTNGALKFSETSEDLILTFTSNVGTFTSSTSLASLVFTGITPTFSAGAASTTVVASVGVQSTATAVTATTGGATTGLIPANASVVVVTSDSANKQITLPAPVVGMQTTIIVGATGCELIATGSSVKINDVVCSATNEAALAADTHYVCTCISATEWIMVGYTKLGAVDTAVIPDTL